MVEYVLGKNYSRCIVNIDIPDFVRSVGVFTSGGIDSTVLLYVLLSYRKTHSKKFKISALTVDKTKANVYGARILKKLSELFGEIPHRQSIDNTGSRPGAVTQAIARMREDVNYDLIFTGVNSNPPTDIVQFNGPYPVRPLSNNHKNLELPFMHLYKSHIIELAYLIDAGWLFPYTHSCTELDFDMCGICFACQEREWGFLMNKKNDPGFIGLFENEI